MASRRMESCAAQANCDSSNIMNLPAAHRVCRQNGGGATEPYLPFGWSKAQLWKVSQQPAGHRGAGQKLAAAAAFLLPCAGARGDASLHWFRLRLAVHDK